MHDYKSFSKHLNQKIWESRSEQRRSEDIMTGKFGIVANLKDIRTAKFGMVVNLKGRTLRAAKKLADGTNYMWRGPYDCKICQNSWGHYDYKI